MKKYPKNTINIKRLAKYKNIGRAILNIGVIFFSVTLSILFNNWNEHRKQQAEVIVFLNDLKEDLKLDIESMKHEKNNMEIFNSRCQALNDSLINTNSESSISMSFIFRKTNNGTFEGFKSSGKIGNIENPTIKKDILQYYQSNVKIQEELENLLNNQMSMILDFLIKESKSETSRQKILTILGLTIQLTNSMIDCYDENIEFSNKIIKEI